MEEGIPSRGKKFERVDMGKTYSVSAAVPAPQHRI